MSIALDRRSSPAADPAQLLETLPLFYDFSHNEIRKIAACTREQFFDPRQTVFRTGDSPDLVYFVLSGLVRLSLNDSREIGPDDLIIRSKGIFGEDCAVDESPRGIFATALMRTHCLTISAQAFRRLEEENSRLALKLLRKLARTTSLRLRQVVGRRALPLERVLAAPKPAPRLERKPWDGVLARIGALKLASGL